MTGDFLGISDIPFCRHLNPSARQSAAPTQDDTSDNISIPDKVPYLAKEMLAVQHLLNSKGVGM